MENNELERAVLAGLAADSMDLKERSTDESLDELEALLETAGGECRGKVLQNKRTPDPRTFIGEGKVKELKALVEAEDCSLAVFDNELSPSQTRALEEELGVHVVDRSQLILDIFAQRAQTREGRLQVELAQYKYMLPRLTGMWTHLVRQTASGGKSPIGTRGPGETQLETDRRHIRRKIQKLSEELEEVRRVRSTQRRQREKNGMPVIALVGYTNAGKSTLLNRLTDAGIPANDRLFDTLDTTTRKLTLAPGSEALISDTVGFIRKLPHHLVEAFKATLEELKFADVLVHVIDASSPQREEQVDVVRRLIYELGASETPCIEVYNKSDKCENPDDIPRGENIFAISARTGAGTDKLLENIMDILGRGKKHVVLHIPYEKAGLCDLLHREAEVRSMDYEESFIRAEVTVSPELWGQVREFEYREDA
ncbi:MAG: GTPase HflX [Oscillospiraceae bacterium]